MCRVKILGVQTVLERNRDELSDVFHECVVEAFDDPVDKRTHRFFTLAPENFRYPASRSDSYTIIEVSLFEGRTVAAKKRFYGLIYERCQSRLGIEAEDIEILLTESPRHNWGIRGLPGDELGLAYTVGV
jgi:phenylpyruvate tautomerase PptA (4-oxalocrotonate tautomerase family)